MAHLLIIEDEPAMQLGLRDNLELEGHTVEVAGDGESGLAKIKAGKFDLVVLDVMLPRLSGFDVCKAVRTAGIRTPILLLTAKGEEIDKVIGLELGADDYLTKPFGVRELLARIKAILRRTQKDSFPDKNNIITIGRLAVNFAAFQTTENGEEIKLSHKEFEILSYLYENRNQLVTRNDLLEHVWGYAAQITTRTVDNFIVRLRQKVEVSPDHPKIILTVHGSGYKMVL